MEADAQLEQIKFEVSLPESVKKQCEVAWSHCSSAESFTGTNGECRRELAALLAYSPKTFKNSVQQLFENMQIDNGCDILHPRCIASFGSYVGGGACCGQSGQVTELAEICPYQIPVCEGYVLGKEPGRCKKVSAEKPWSSGETLECKNTPGWTNGYVHCSSQTDDTHLCQPGGWTCAGYLKNQFCAGGLPAHWSSTPADGPRMNYPEKNCCGCGKSSGIWS